MASASSSSSALPALAPFRGHSPPRWIFSYAAQQPLEQVNEAAAHFLPTPIPPPKPARRSGLGSRIDLGANEDEEDWQGAYGPTLRRKGNVKFVKAKLGGLAGDEVIQLKREVKQEVQEVPQDKGNTVRGLYESIVGVRATPIVPLTPSRPPNPSPTPDVDLTLLSDGDDSDDDCVIIDPSTGLPAPLPPRVKRLRPKKRPLAAIADLLPQDLSNPHTPPVQYAIKPSNIGWRMLARQGWVEGQGLGPVVAEGSEAGATAKRLKVPLQGVEKFDRRGLGTDGKGHGPKKTREEREEERKRQQLLEKERRGKGARGMSIKVDRENRERKEMIAYMNR